MTFFKICDRLILSVYLKEGGDVSDQKKETEIVEQWYQDLMSDDKKEFGDDDENMDENIFLDIDDKFDRITS